MKQIGPVTGAIYGAEGGLFACLSCAASNVDIEPIIRNIKKWPDDQKVIA